MSDAPIPRWVLAAALLVFFVGLGGTDLWPSDEPRAGAVAEEMRSFVHGARGLVVLHLNGAPYTQKPPLYYWLAALFGTFAGRVTETAARLPSAVAALCTVAFVIWLGRTLFRPGVGVLAGALLLATPGFVTLGRSARVDALLAGLVTAAFAAAWRLDRGIGSEPTNRFLLHGAIGLGVLTKGPVAFLFPALGLLAYLAWEGRLRELRRFASLPSLLLSLGPGLAWLATAIAVAPAGFAAEALWDNLVLRFAAGSSHARPIWFYLEEFPIGVLPLTLLWPLVWLRWRELAHDEAATRIARGARFLLALIGAALLFLSLSVGKRGSYLLPVYPLVALACAEPLASRLEQCRVPSWLPRWWPGDPVRAFTLALLLLVVTLEGAWLWIGLPALNERNSPRAIAALASHHVPHGEPIGLLGRPQLAGGLWYYGSRPVEPLRDADEVAAFFAAGGRVIVVEGHEFEVLDTTPHRVLARGRIGRRQLLVIGPLTPSGAGGKSTLR